VTIAASIHTTELIALEPQNRELYEQNAASYRDMLKGLDKEYRAAFESCAKSLVIVNHNAIGYIAHNYGFRVESLSGFSPDAQPNPKDLTRIFTEIKNEGVSTLFFESFVSNKTIKTVAKDANIALEVGKYHGKRGRAKTQLRGDNAPKSSKTLQGS